MAKITFHDSTKVVRAGFDTKEWPFKPLKEFIGQTVPVNGFFTSKGKYGEQAVIIANGVLVNMPARTLEEVQQIAENKEYLDKLMEGKMTIQNIHMQEFKNGTGVAYDFDIAE